MRPDTRHSLAHSGALRAALCTLLALFAGTASAEPRIEAIAEPADHLVGCGFRTVGESPTGGRLVLYWNADRATMKVDGKTTALKVTVEQCTSDCVAPGKSGTQVFRFTGSDGVQATLRTRVHCPRDAEVCSGLFAEQARLAVSSARGKALLRVRNEDCDY